MTIEVSKAQLKHYADVICHCQAGKSHAEIAALAGLLEWLVALWHQNWRELDMRVAA